MCHTSTCRGIFQASTHTLANAYGFLNLMTVTVKNKSHEHFYVKALAVCWHIRHSTLIRPSWSRVVSFTRNCSYFNASDIKLRSYSLNSLLYIEIHCWKWTMANWFLWSLWKIEGTQFSKKQMVLNSTASDWWPSKCTEIPAFM